MTISQKAVGIKDIAKAMKISIGTVDRALHGRAGINEKTKALVLKKANELGYRPNVAAQALKLNRTLSIAVVLPKHIACFFDPVRAGIRAAAEATVSVKIRLDFYEYPRVGVGDVEALETAAKKHYDGIICLPSNTRQFNTAIRQLSRSGTAIMCVASDAPDSGRTASVMTHASISGSIAAELLSLNLQHKTSVAILTGEISTFDHAEKLRGFAATLAVLAPHLNFLPAIESHERPREAYRQTLALMKCKPRPEGLYLSTANSISVLQALEELGLLGKIKVITTDFFQELLPLIESGKILATLYQRPFTQGKLAFGHLLKHLLGDSTFQPTVRLAPHIILRSNLSLFSAQIAENDEEMGE